MEEEICQSCSMPLSNKEEIGTEKDGSLSDEYCIYCWKDGEFVHEITLEEAIARGGEYADEIGVTKEEALAYSREVLPTLKRWR